MEWTTRVTELLGCKYPILQGALAGLGNWKFAAAVSETGAFGMMTASVSRIPERLREDIILCRNLTDKPFGVNLSRMSEQVEKEMLEVCIQEGVTAIETASYKPDALAPRIKEAGLKWIHKSARVKDAIHAEKLGVDAVIVVGLEGTGFKSPEQLPTMITTTWAKREIKIPFIAAGGIGDARGFLGALAMGADAIMMGTTFMVTRECPLSEAAKEAMVQACPDDPQIRHQVLEPPDPEAYAEAMSMRDKVPLDKWLRMLEGVGLKDRDWRIADDTAGPGGRKLCLMSLAVGVIDGVPTVKEFVDGIIHGAEGLLDSYRFLKTRQS